jgi:hypothetical protein
MSIIKGYFSLSSDVYYTPEGEKLITLYLCIGSKVNQISSAKFASIMSANKLKFDGKYLSTDKKYITKYYKSC